MSKDNRRKFDYRRAENDLYDVGARHPEDIYDSRSEKTFRKHMKEYGLNPDKYIKPDNNRNTNNSGSSGCYLTTACVIAKGLPDDCAELQTLRAFRDSYMIALPNGREEIEQYYRMAPGIVEAINQRDDHREIWKQVYEELVAPCVQMVQNKEYETAYQHYKTYAMSLNAFCLSTKL